MNSKCEYCNEYATYIMNDKPACRNCTILNIYQDKVRYIKKIEDAERGKTYSVLKNLGVIK